jgi:hypothetical protein
VCLLVGEWAVVIQLFVQEARQVEPIPEGGEGAAGDIAHLSAVLGDTVEIF